MTPSPRMARLGARAVVAGLRLAVRLPAPWIAQGLRSASRIARSLAAPATLCSDLEDLAQAFADRPRQAALVRRVLLESHPGELEGLAVGALGWARRAVDPGALVSARRGAGGLRDAPGTIDLRDGAPGDGGSALAHLRAGRDVRMPFPPAADLASARALRAAAHATGRTVVPVWEVGALPAVHGVEALLAANAVGRVNGIRIGVLLGADARLDLGPVGWLEPLALALLWLGPIADLHGPRPVARDGTLAPVVLRWRHARPGCLGALDLTHAPGLSMARGRRELRIEISGTDGLILLSGPDGSTGAEPSLRLYRGTERLDLSAAAGLAPVEAARPPRELPPDETWRLAIELLTLLDRLDPARPR